MTQEEVLYYNYRCAKFLGAIYSTHLKAWGFGNATNVGSMKYRGITYQNVIQAQRFETELKFDSDWNWIMDIYVKVNKFIQEKSTTDFVFGKETNDLHLNIWSALEDENCSQEAVVEAINQFLIWYENNK